MLHVEELIENWPAFFPKKKKKNLISFFSYHFNDSHACTLFSKALTQIKNTSVTSSIFSKRDNSY